MKSKKDVKNNNILIAPCLYCKSYGDVLYFTPNDHMLLSLGGYGWRVRCMNSNCIALGPLKKSKSKAIEAWNCYEA